MVKYFNHIGICVHSIDKTFAWMQKTMGAKMPVEDELSALNQVSAIVALQDDKSRFESDGTDRRYRNGSGVSRKKGEGFHHLSLYTENVGGELRLF